MADAVMTPTKPPSLTLADLSLKYQQEMEATVKAFQAQMQAAVSAFATGTRMPQAASPEDWAMISRILAEPKLKAQVAALVAATPLPTPG